VVARKFNSLFESVKWSIDPCEKLLWGVMLLGGANREAPAQAELRPTCAGPAMSKRQRVEWALLRQTAPYLNAYFGYLIQCLEEGANARPQRTTLNRYKAWAGLCFMALRAGCTVRDALA
jgi:hypothetical protein